jgi:hypothetical protein
MYLSYLLFNYYSFNIYPIDKFVSFRKAECQLRMHGVPTKLLMKLQSLFNLLC